MMCYAGIICEQNLMFCYEFDCWYYVLDFCQDQLGKWLWKVLLYDNVVCFLVVLDSVFETLAHIWATLRSLLKELACLTVLNTVKQASSFNRDLRVCVLKFQKSSPIPPKSRQHHHTARPFILFCLAGHNSPIIANSQIHNRT